MTYAGLTKFRYFNIDGPHFSSERAAYDCNLHFGAASGDKLGMISGRDRRRKDQAEGQFSNTLRCAHRTDVAEAITC
jgi:hypothetical protein